MAKSYIWISLTLFLIFEILISSTLAATDHLDVEAINDLYENLGYPSQLTGWKSDGGDPCEENWKGVSCNGTSIIYIELAGLGLSGHLGRSLYLQNLKQLDLSSNYIQGEIPNYLPLNLTHLDFSCNNFSMNIPYSLAFVKHLHHLNLSHNFQSGPVGNLFTAMQNLRRMDLSYNSLAGDLPSSFANLTNLTDLYLQENKFTGSVIFLAHLHLTNLNMENNNFSGVIPKQFQNVPNLWIGGNRFQSASIYPPRSNVKTNSPVKRMGGEGFLALVALCALVIICAGVILARYWADEAGEDPDLPEITEKAPYGEDSPIFLMLKRGADLARSEVQAYLTELSGFTRIHTVELYYPNVEEESEASMRRDLFEKELTEFIHDGTQVSISYLVKGEEGLYPKIALRVLRPEEVYVYPTKLVGQEAQSKEVSVCLMARGRGANFGTFTSCKHFFAKLNRYDSYDGMERAVSEAFCLDNVHRVEWEGVGGSSGGIVTDAEKRRFKVWRGAVGRLYIFC